MRKCSLPSLKKEICFQSWISFSRPSIIGFPRTPFQAIPFQSLGVNNGFLSIYNFVFHAILEGLETNPLLTFRTSTHPDAQIPIRNSVGIFQFYTKSGVCFVYEIRCVNPLFAQYYASKFIYEIRCMHMQYASA